MAIPISRPTNSDDSDENYLTLELLLEQLLVTLRQILAQRRLQDMTNLSVRHRTVHTPQPPHPVQPSNDQNQQDQSVTHNVPHPRLPLPDVISDHTECESPRSRKSSESQTMIPEAAEPSRWVLAGCQLRHIADAFRADRNTEKMHVDGKDRFKEASLLSLLCPALGRSLWTTIALLVGWGFFQKKR